MAKRAGRPKKSEPTGDAPKKRGPRAKGGTFARMIASERKRLDKARQSIAARKRQFEQELAGIERELAAMEHFMRAKQGMAAGKRGGKRAKRGAVRETILQIIKSAPEGLTRGEIIQKLNATEKAAQQSVSNALSNMFKASNLKRAGRKYLAA